MVDDGLFGSVARFLRVARSTPTLEPAAPSEPEPKPLTPDEVPLAVVIQGLSSIESVSQLLSVTNAEVMRLEQSLVPEQARAEAAYATRNGAGLQASWDAERQLNERLDAERQRQRLLVERLSELTAGEISGINSTVRAAAEAINAKMGERSERLVAAVKALEAVVSEWELEGARTMAAAEERATAAYQQLSERCAGFAPSGQLQLNQALAHPRIDRVVSATENILTRLRALQR